MHDERVPVTGSAGFIGSNLTGSLAENNGVVVDDEFLATPENPDDAVEYHDDGVLADNPPTGCSSACCWRLTSRRPSASISTRSGTNRHDSVSFYPIAPRYPCLEDG